MRCLRDGRDWLCLVGGCRWGRRCEPGSPGFQASPVDRVFTDTLRTVEEARPELSAVIGMLGHGGVFVVFSLSSLARCIPHAMRVLDEVIAVGADLVVLDARTDTREDGGAAALAGLRAMETLHRSLTRTRQQVGQGSPGARTKGRPPVINEQQPRRARSLRANGVDLHDLP